MVLRRSLWVCSCVALLTSCTLDVYSDMGADAAAPPVEPTDVSDTSDAPTDDTTGEEDTTDVPPAPPVTPPDLTEESGYTPVRNADGSIARPMWLSGDAVTTRFARLTNEQWQRSVRDLLHLSSLPTEESKFFETIGAGATDFVNDQSRLQMSNTQWAQFQAAAEALAKRVGETDAAMAEVHAESDAETFIREFGLRAFRRPLKDAEVERYAAVFDTGSKLSGDQSAFTKGAGLVIETMLQSPNFIYRTEVGKAGSPLSGYEKAAKLSLYILRTTPSDDLLDKAGEGKLDNTDGLVAEARTMLETEAAAETFGAFHSELYELSRFSSISKSDPAFTADVGSELVAASEAFFDRIYRQDFGLHEILTTRRGFVGPATAGLYGISPAPSELLEMALPKERAGFFTQLPYLAYFSRDTQSYGVLRGVHLNTEVLCAKLPELGMPAPSLPEVKYTTSREYMEKGTACGGACHSEYINPLGFSMENFDGMGRTRTEDNGVAVDTTGEYPFIGGMSPFDGAVDLMNQIAANEMAHECYSRYVASYGLGRMLGETDAQLIKEMATNSLTSKASTKDLIIELVSSAEFSAREGGK